MSLVFTMPGKIGDALLQWPVAYWHCTQQNAKCELWLDENCLKPLGNLFMSQPCVEAVTFKPGITSYEMGGQPWDFGLSTQDHVENEICHLGFRKFPSRQITLETCENVPLRIERQSHMRSLMVAAPAVGHSRLLLHGTFASHTSGTPSFWRFLSDHADEFDKRFDEVCFVGTEAERVRASEIYPKWRSFNDGGEFIRLAEYMSGATMMIGSGSSNVVLAGLLGVPTVRVHDPIGEHPKVIWSNLGSNQLNATERELRDEWPIFRAQWLDKEVLTGS